jgi:amino acid transporter
VAIIATTTITLILMVIVGAEGVGTLAGATVTFLLSVFSMVCFCGIILRRDDVEHEHYRAPIALLWLGIVVNLALLGYVVVDDLRALADGEITALQSTSAVTGILLAVGLVLFVLNNLTQHKLDTADKSLGT